MEVIVLIILGGLAAFLVAIASVAKQNTADRIQNTADRIDERFAAQQARLARQHPRARIFASQIDHSIMVIDFEEQKIILGLAETLTGTEKTYESIYGFSNIIGVEVRTDGNTISSTNRGDQALGAAVGAVAFGGVGAIIGGLSGSSTSQKQLKKLSIRVAVDDTERPLHEVTFFQSDAGLPIDDTLLQPCLKEADTFEAYIINAIRKSKTASSNGSNGLANSSATALRDLWALKQEGDIVAGDLVRMACERHLMDLETGADRGLYFDCQAASRIIRWGGMLQHTTGPMAGMPLKLEPWQEFRHGSVFGWKRSETGLRRFQSTYHQVGKKNGKTTDTAVPMLFTQLFDGEAAPQGYCAATTKNQAGLLFKEMKRMIKRSPFLKEFLDVSRTSIEAPRTDGLIACLRRHASR